MPIMFLKGLDFSMNFLYPGLTNTTVKHTANTHRRCLLIRCDRLHVVLIESHVMKLAWAGAGPHYVSCESMLGKELESSRWNWANNLQWPAREHEDWICVSYNTAEPSVPAFGETNQRGDWVRRRRRWKSCCLIQVSCWLSKPVQTPFFVVT